MKEYIGKEMKIIQFIKTFITKFIMQLMELII